MNNSTRMLAVGLALVLSVNAWAGVEVRLKNGSRWRGELDEYVKLKLVQNGVDVEFEGYLTAVHDLYIKVEGEVAGRVGKKTIFKADIRSMHTVVDTVVHADARPTTSSSAEPEDENQLGVFVLPMSGTVGETFRHHEIEMLAEHADEWGDGQIIVLIMDSHGGGLEMARVHETISKIKDRHRIVAWVKTAISAAAASALACDEIYFETGGTLGAMTGYSGTTALQGKELQAWMKTAREWMAEGGRYPYIADAMIHAPSLLSYDRDEETGEITWYNTLEGEVDLSNGNQNLVFTASTAMHSGFADGIANNQEELAALLKLPRWREKSDYGREIAAKWQKTVDAAKKDIPRLIARRNYWKTSGSVEERLGALIQIDKKLLRWIVRAPDLTAQRGLDKRMLEREIEEIRKQLADMKRRR